MAVWIGLHTKNKCLAIANAIKGNEPEIQMYVDGDLVDQRTGMLPDHIFGEAWKITGYSLGSYKIRGRRDDPELGFLIPAHFVQAVWEE